MSGDAPPRHFGDRLAAAVAGRETQVVLGLDPDPARLWPVGHAAGEKVSGSVAHRAAEAVFAHCEAVIEAVSEACVAAKLQLACFERLGASGWCALERVAGCAQANGLLVIADAKRGDIDVSAAAYAQAFVGATQTPWGEVHGIAADAVTISPYLGPDTLEPFVAAARERGRGVFVLVRTSNPGGAFLQDAELAEGGTVWERMAGLVTDLGAQGSRISDVGAVTGATVPEHLERLRELMPTAPFLLPGIGAQGGSVADVAPAFAPGRAGGLVTSSRGIVRAHEQAGGDPGAAARAEAERLREQAWALSG
ncbi:MAG: orotidine-5'-phosphate decarboxylase [Solirubrobacteraceae bacterium]